MEDVSLFAATLLLVLCDAAQLAPTEKELTEGTKASNDGQRGGDDEEEEEEDVDKVVLCREELLCHVAEFILYGILAPELDSFDMEATSGFNWRRLPRHFELMLTEIGVALPEGLESTDGADEDRFDFDFKEECGIHL